MSLDQWKTDWHLHTTASDGTVSPEELLELLGNAGITHFAVTDHDTLSEWKVINSFTAPRLMRGISGIEFSVDFKESEELGAEVHILGYGIDPENSQLNSYLTLLQNSRKTRFEKLLHKAEESGFRVAQEAALLLEKEESPGRLHLARLLVKNGYFPNIRCVFSEFLSPGRPGYVKRFYYPLEDILDLIHHCGGLAVVAHPFQIKDEWLRNQILQQPRLDGIEVFHPSHLSEQSAFLMAECAKNKKYATGGSDYHGDEKRFIRRYGDFKVPTQELLPFLEWSLSTPNGRWLGGEK